MDADLRAGRTVVRQREAVGHHVVHTAFPLHPKVPYVICLNCEERVAKQGKMKKVSSHPPKKGWLETFYALRFRAVNQIFCTQSRFPEYMTVDRIEYI